MAGLPERAVGYVKSMAELDNELTTHPSYIQTNGGSKPMNLTKTLYLSPWDRNCGTKQIQSPAKTNWSPEGGTLALW